MLVVRRGDCESPRAEAVASGLEAALRADPRSKNLRGTVVLGPGPPGVLTAADERPRVAVILPGQRAPRSLVWAAAAQCDAVITTGNENPIPGSASPRHPPILRVREPHGAFLRTSSRVDAIAALEVVNAHAVLSAALHLDVGEVAEGTAHLVDVVILAITTIASGG